jgi:hypothetical protein
VANDVATLCDPRSVQPAITAGAKLQGADKLAKLTGSYTIVVTAVPRLGADSVVRGHLTLYQNDSAHAAFGAPISGWMTADVRRLSVAYFAVSPGSRNPDRPGVQIRADGAMIVASPRTLEHADEYTQPHNTYPDEYIHGYNAQRQPSPGDSMYMGPNVSMCTHCGLLFTIRLATRVGLAGDWFDGAPVTPSPGGYFCAVRSEFARLGGWPSHK